MSRDRRARDRLGRAGRAVVVAVLIGVAGVHAVFALGAGGMVVPRCSDPLGLCALIALQAGLAVAATLSLLVAAYRVRARLPAAGLVFVGTLPLWLFHVPLVVFLPDEDLVFAVMTAVTPMIAGMVWLARRTRERPEQERGR